MLLVSVLICSRLWTFSCGLSLTGEGESSTDYSLSKWRSFSWVFMMSIRILFFSFIYISLLLSYIFKCYILALGSLDSLPCSFSFPPY